MNSNNTIKYNGATMIADEKVKPEVVYTIKKDATNSTLTTVQNSGTVQLGNCIIWPNNYQNWYSYPVYYPITSPTPWVAIEKAENGFIVKKAGKTFVCKTEKEVLEVLKEKE